MDTRHRLTPKILTNSRALRANMTDAERLMWRSLRGKQINEARFRRQHPIGPYIADFVCIEKMLVIELDGRQHQDQVAYDDERSAYLAGLGGRVLRFWNNDVMQNLDGVLATVLDELSAVPPS